jgi:hypothetical protein
MSEQPPSKPNRKSNTPKRGEDSKRAREERQAKALRDNLLRRKQQNRSRGQKVMEPENDKKA